MRWGSARRELVVSMLALIGVTVAIVVSAVLAIDSFGGDDVGRVPPDDLPNVETGLVDVGSDWIRAEFTSSFVDPVVVAGPADSQEVVSGIVEVAAVTPAGFDVRFVAWTSPDDSHGKGTTPYLAVERGLYEFPSGAMIEAGVVEAASPGTWHRVDLAGPFPAPPAVLVTADPGNEGQVAEPRVRSVDTSGFELALGTAGSGPWGPVDVSYVAWSGGSGTEADGWWWSSGTLELTFEWTAAAFVLGEGTACALASVNTHRETDPVGVRSRTEAGQLLELRLEGRHAEADEDGNLTEQVGYVAAPCGPAPDTAPSLRVDEDRTPSTGTEAVTEGSQEPSVEETSIEDGRDRHLIGSNLSLPDPRGTEIAFRDRFKLSSPWISGSPGVWDDGRPVDTDEHGWVRSLLPDQIARTTMMQADAGYYPGDYVVLYEGRGTMSYIGATPVSSSPGRDVIAVSDSLRIDITEVDPSDHLREIRVVPLAEEALFETHPFNPDFLASLDEYSALRFMNWMRTNGSQQEHWSDGPTPDSARFTEDGGVPVEVMIDLANTLRTDPWFNIPHLADDDYVMRFASVVYERLDPSLIPIIELSNEVGNTTFGQHADYRATGTTLGLDPDPYTAAMKYHSMRSSEVFQIWETVFGDEADFTAAIHPSTRAMEPALDHGDVLEHADMLLVDAYFAFEPNRVDRCQETAALDLDAFFELMSSEWVPRTLEGLEKHRKVAASRNLTLGVYEGGHHLRQNTGCGIDNQNTIGELFDSAVADPRMKDAYLQLLDGVVDTDVVLFAHYHNIRQHDFSNRFGARRTLLEERTASPVYDALMTFIEGIG